MNLKKYMLLGCLAIFAIISCGKKEAKQDEDQDEIQIEQQSADSTATNSSNNSQENTAATPAAAQPAAEAAEAAANKTTENINESANIQPPSQVKAEEAKTSKTLQHVDKLIGKEIPMEDRVLVFSKQNNQYKITYKGESENGMQVAKLDVWKSTWILGLSMVFGLLIAIFFSYRKNREYQDLPLKGIEIEEAEKMETKHWLTLVAALAAFVVPARYGSLPLGALAALVLMFVFGVLKWKDIDKTISGGMQLMGLIAFIMLVASGYAAVIKQTGAIQELVNSIYGMIGGSKALGVSVMLLVGLLITMGIGTSFGTIPVVAAIYIPLCLKLGVSVPGSVVILAAAAALGDAGSPASDSTLGPTSGLNADGQHDHIWDTCVPTFIHYNIPLLIGGFIGGMFF